MDSTAMNAGTPLQRTVRTTATDVWNDSCDVDELAYAIDQGAVGATTNPSIVLDVLRKDPATWRDRARELWTHPGILTEAELADRIAEEVAVRGAKLLEPVFRREGGRKGRLSMQVNPTWFRDSAAMVEQALHFVTLAPNLQVKFPDTLAGLAAIEEATYRGVSVTVTVNFSVAGSLTAAEAIERGLRRREAEGLDTAAMTPVCAIMIGRLDDWMKVLFERDGIIVTPGYADWAGVAVMKRAYALFRERGYRTRLLAAAYRHHLHWSELIGGDVILTIPHPWQVRFNASEVEVRPRMDESIEARILDELLDRVPDFRRAYEPDGLSDGEMDTFGPTVRTLRAFIRSYHDLLATVRDFVMPDPDRKAG